VQKPLKNPQIMKAPILLLLGLLINPMIFAQWNCWENITNTDKISCIYNDKDTLWLGTSGGVTKYVKSSDDSFCYNKANFGLPSNTILDIAKDSKQNLWVASRFNGIGCSKNGKSTVYNSVNSNLKSDQYCSGIYIDNNDTVFFGSNIYFNSIYKGALKTYLSGNPIYSQVQDIRDIVASADGSLMLGTSYGLYKYQNGTISLLLPLVCNGLKYDKAGNLWIATTTKGLAMYSNGICRYFDSTNSEIPNGLDGLDIDKNNTIWLLSSKKLIKFENYRAVSYPADDLQFVSISADDTCVWLGTFKNGLYRFSNDSFHEVPLISSGLKSNNYVNLNVMDNSLLLKIADQLVGYKDQKFYTVIDTVGLRTKPTWDYSVHKNSGIFTFGNKTIVGYFEKGKWLYFDQFQNDNIKGILSISTDTFWVATSNRGLLKYEKGQVREYNMSNSPLKDNLINTLTFDKQGVLWGSFGSNAGAACGIFSFDTNNWSIWTKNQVSILDSPIRFMAFDSENNLWCKASRIVKYNRANWTQHQVPEKIQWFSIYNLFLDKTDTLWISGVGGVYKFDLKNNWEAYTIYNSGLADITVNSAMRLPNGDVYFAHPNNGLSVLKNSSFLNIDELAFTASSDLKVFPNPAQDILTVQIPGNCTSYIIEIVDLSAKLKYTSAWKPTRGSNDLQTINISTYPKGVYIVSLNTNKKSYSKKITIK